MSMKIIDIAFRNLSVLDADHLKQTLNFPGTIVVREDTPALAVVSKVEPGEAGLIVVRDANDEVCGVVFPNWVMKQLGKHRNIASDSLYAALKVLEEDPEEARRRYHHEWLNLERPLLFWCDQGRHFIDTKPCPEHG